MKRWSYYWIVAINNFIAFFSSSSQEFSLFHSFFFVHGSAPLCNYQHKKPQSPTAFPSLTLLSKPIIRQCSLHHGQPSSATWIISIFYVLLMTISKSYLCQFCACSPLGFSDHVLADKFSFLHFLFRLSSCFPFFIN